MCRIPSCLFSALLFVFVSSSVVTIQAQNYQVIYNFAGAPDTAGPSSGLISDGQGNLYGVSVRGGLLGDCYYNGCGTVFKIDSSGSESVLYKFCSLAACADGGSPAGPLVIDSEGNLYGTTSYGGAGTALKCRYGCGTVFKLDPTGNETVLYSFTGRRGDGYDPVGALVIDGMGNLYGATQLGGTTCDCGTVFKIDTLGNETILYRFTGGPDGDFPSAGPILDPFGNLYGSTVQGGESGCGAIYKITAGPIESTLYSFGCQGNAGPDSNLVRDSTGNFYVATESGGGHGYGTISKITTSGTGSVILSFDGSNGSGLGASLAFGADANLYCSSPSSMYYGTVFKLNTAGKYVALHTFAGGITGAFPFGSPFLDSQGNLYGVAYGGGKNGVGVIYKISP